MGTNMSYTPIKIMDEGGILRRRTNLDFIGAGVAAADNTTTKNTEVTISAGGGGVTGSGASPYVAYWNSSGTITGESDFQYNATTNSLSVAGNVTTPIVIGSTSASGTLTLRATSDATDGDIIFQSDATTERARILSTGEFLVGATAVYASEFVLFRKDTNGNTFVRVHNNTSGTAALASMITSNSTANSGSGMWNVSAGYTASGIYQQLSLVVASGSGMTGGINVGTIGNHALSFYTNNTKVGTFLNTGEFIVGASTLLTTEVASIQKNQNALTSLWVSNTTSGTAARSIIGAIGTSNLGVFLQSLSAGYTTSNILVADTGVISCNNVAGLNIGTTSNTQASFWTNNTKRVSITGAGVFTFEDAINIAFNTTTGSKIGTGTTQKIGFWNATPVVQSTGWSVTAGYTTDKSFNPESTSLTEVARVLGTLVDQLKTYGIIGA
jgi:hypothetical protein